MYIARYVTSMKHPILLMVTIKIALVFMKP